MEFGQAGALEQLCGYTDGENTRMGVIPLVTVPNTTITSKHVILGSLPQWRG